MESFCLSPPCLLLQSNFSQAECRQIRRFPEFQVLPLSAHTSRSMTASQNMSTSWNLTGLLCLLGQGLHSSLRLAADFWGKVHFRSCSVVFFFFFSLWVKWFPKIHSGWCLWRLPSGDLPYADGECMLPLELWMSRASVPRWKVQKCSNATAWGPNEGRISLQPLKLLRCNLSVWNH